VEGVIFQLGRKAASNNTSPPLYLFLLKWTVSSMGKVRYLNTQGKLEE